LLYFEFQKTLCFFLGYTQNNMAHKAIDLFKEIKNPNEICLTLLFNACAQLETEEALNLTKNVSKNIGKSMYSNVRLLTSLLDALMKCGDVAYAQSLFNTLTNKSIGIYGAMMKG